MTTGGGLASSCCCGGVTCPACNCNTPPNAFCGTAGGSVPAPPTMNIKIVSGDSNLPTTWCGITWEKSVAGGGPADPLSDTQRRSGGSAEVCPATYQKGCVTCTDTISYLIHHTCVENWQFANAGATGNLVMNRFRASTKSTYFFSCFGNGAIQSLRVNTTSLFDYRKWLNSATCKVFLTGADQVNSTFWLLAGYPLIPNFIPLNVPPPTRTAYRLSDNGAIGATCTTCGPPESVMFRTLGGPGTTKGGITYFWEKANNWF